MLNHPDRLFPADPSARAVARMLYRSVADAPIISPHGHVEPRWFADNAHFSNATELLVLPDHYLLRMLVSQGISLEALGVAPKDGAAFETDAREIWRRFAERYHLFAATPSRLWLDHVFENLFGLDRPLGSDTADSHFDRIGECLLRDAFKPRALYERFGIEVIATTDAALDPLDHHRAIRESGWTGRVIPTFRPDDITDPDRADFRGNLDRLGAITGCDTTTWPGYLDAIRVRRNAFKALGATATDHGVAQVATANLSRPESAALFDRVRTGQDDAKSNALFRAQMVTEMAKMSLDDGLVMQIHAGVTRNHAPEIHHRFGSDKGFDIPDRGNFVHGLKPLLDAVGLEPGLRIILFTLDESTYARELAPLAGAYPSLFLGPAWWFHDSPEGMLRYRRMTTETAGFYNTVGFNDDTRAFLSIPARHDVARRIDARFLSELVCDHRLREEEALLLMQELSGGLARRAYRLGGTP